MPEQSGNHQPGSLLASFELPLFDTYYPFGFPLELATNSLDVVEAARESWGRFQETFAEEPVQLRIAVREDDRVAPLPMPLFHAQRNLLAILSDTGDFAIGDLNEGFGYGCIAASTAVHHAHFRYYYLEAVAYCLLQALYLAPIHAACVALNNRGVLLCGDSGAGKSSLAYACAQRGWTLISDDASYLVRSWDQNVVVGNPHLIRLRESAPELFPELRGHALTLRAQGDRAIELSTAGYRRWRTSLYSPVERVVFLNRQSAGAPGFAPFPREKALRWLEGILSIGEQETREAQADCFRRMVPADVLEFRYSDLDSAVGELASLIGVALPSGCTRDFSPSFQSDE